MAPKTALAAVADVQPADAPRPRWPAFDVEKWEIGRLRRNPRNAKIHPKAQIDQLRKLMRDYGWTVPVLARENGELIAGHGRLEAGIAEGYKEAPVIVARGWTDEQCRMYAIADNRVTERGKWNRDVLNLELGELSALGFDLAPIGFSIASLPGGGSTLEGTNLEIKPIYQVLIDCASEAAQLEVIKDLKARGLNCRALIS
jgi:ParB-like chromosome segregation protein Spo0J